MNNNILPPPNSGILSGRRRFTSRNDDCPYQKVEYLEASQEEGSVWINTEYCPQGNDIDIFIGYMPLRPRVYNFATWVCNFSNVNAGLYGVRHGSFDGNIQLLLGNTSNGAIYAPVQCSFGTKYEIELRHERKFKINGIEGDLNSFENNTNTNPITIFNRVDSLAQSYGRIYHLRIDKAGVTEFDLIPVRIGNEGYMYDRVSGKLFGNAGTGKFILGPDIN